MGADRVITMLAEPAPSAADTDAAGYYRLDKRSRRRPTGSESTAQWRQPSARAARGARLARTWGDAYTAVAAQPADRVVRTRHGDAVLLTDFMVTRVVELAIHGLDFADAFDRLPWTHDRAIEVVTRLLLSEAAWPRLDALGWGRMTLLRVAASAADGTAGRDVAFRRTTGVPGLDVTSVVER